MKTYVFEGKITALSSISHNGGEMNGNIAQLRREGFVQKDGSVEEVPVLSGNMIRGILRDKGMYHMLRKLGLSVDEETGEIQGIPLPAFQFLFSGGALTSTSKSGVDVDYFRKMRETAPIIGLFGGAIGNRIMPGKMKIGKMIPISDETEHLIPDRFIPDKYSSVWDYCQQEMYTRRDDENNDKVRRFLKDGNNPQELAKQRSGSPQQMIYHIETLKAGTQFYWKIVLEDVTDVEFEAFITTLLDFSRAPFVGGKSATGHGEIAMKMDNWIEIDSRLSPEGKEVDTPLGSKYEKHLDENKEEILNMINDIE